MSIERLKARLVAKGFHQQEGIDFRMPVRTILTISSALHWSLHHLNVCNAFLNGDLQEEVFMSQLY